MQNIINGLPIAAVILLLAVGFAFLVKGADFFVEGSSSIAKKLKVPPIIIGLTIVAMGNFTARNSRECDCFSGTE